MADFLRKKVTYLCSSCSLISHHRRDLNPNRELMRESDNRTGAGSSELKRPQDSIAGWLKRAMTTESGPWKLRFHPTVEITDCRGLFLFSIVYYKPSPSFLMTDLRPHCTSTRSLVNVLTFNEFIALFVNVL